MMRRQIDTPYPLTPTNAQPGAAGTQATQTSHKAPSSALLIHEFKAPIVDLIALIKGRELANLSTIFDVITGRLQHFMKMIERLLSEITHSETQKSQWIDPDDFLCSLIQQLSAMPTLKGLQLNYASKLPLDQEFLINAPAFELLARNLIANSVSYTSVGSVDILLDEGEVHLKLCITDCGPGLHQKKADFLRGHRLNVPSGPGSGILLVRHATEILGATINIIDRSNQGAVVVQDSAKSGTIFEILIPGRWRSSESRQSAPSIAADLSGLQVRAPDLCAQLETLGLKHESCSALKLNFHLDAYPHIVCTQDKAVIEDAPYPCSQKNLTQIVHKIWTAPTTLATEQAADGAEGALEQMPEQAPALQRLALVIDDSPFSRQRLEQLMQAKGWLIATAEDHKAACRKQKRCQFDLIIQDACLPGEAQENDVTNTPKVAISAEKELAEGLCRGAGLWIDTLVKPIEAEDIDQTLGYWATSPQPEGWNLELARSRIGDDLQQTLACNSEMLKDYLNSWPKLLRAHQSDQPVKMKTELHRLYGGLLYTGFPLLQKLTQKTIDQLKQGFSLSEEDVNTLRRGLRHAITLFKNQNGQHKIRYLNDG